MKIFINSHIYSISLIYLTCDVYSLCLKFLLYLIVLKRYFWHSKYSTNDQFFSMYPFIILLFFIYIYIYIHLKYSKDGTDFFSISISFFSLPSLTIYLFMFIEYIQTRMLIKIPYDSQHFSFKIIISTSF